MTTQSIVCASCNAAVPYGRLSCPECGELLASVAGGRRVVAGAVTGRASADSPAAPGAAAVWALTPSDSHQALASVPDVGSIPEPAAAAAPVVPELDWPAEPWDEPETDEWDGLPAADPAPLLDLTDDHELVDEPPAEPPWVADPPAPVRFEPSVLMSVPGTAGGGAAAFAPSGIGWGAAAAPGAYVPPAPIPAVPAGAPAPARTWAGHTDAALTDPAVTSPETSATRIDEFVRWLAVAGSALAAVGFLLPMATIVIGSSGTEYLARWGLAGPYHVVVVAALLAVLGLALAADRVPLWIRVGLPGLGLGALLTGLVWPYLLVDVLDAGPGAFAIIVGAIMLGTAGVVALATDRHRSPDPAV